MAVSATGLLVRHLVLASELASSHRAPRPLLVFAGRTWRSFVVHPRSSASRTPPHTSSPTRWPFFLGSTRVASRRSRVLRFQPTGRHSQPVHQATGSLPRVDARELRRHLVASIFKSAGRRFPPAHQSSGGLYCVDARKSRRHLAASAFQPTGRWHVASCRCARVVSAPCGLQYPTRTSRTPPLASSRTCWRTLVPTPTRRHSSLCVLSLQRDGHLCSPVLAHWLSRASTCTPRSARTKATSTGITPYVHCTTVSAGIEPRTRKSRDPWYHTIRALHYRVRWYRTTHV